MTSGHFSIPASADTVVVVDDDQTLLRTMRRQLANRGLRCQTAERGARALELVTTLKPAVVITDYAMPELDGIELLARTAELSPGTVRVLMTAYADECLLARALNEAHAECYLRKPYSEEELDRVLEESLELGHRTRQGDALLVSTSAVSRQLDIIARAQREALATGNLRSAFDALLDGVLEITASGCGFIAELLRDERGHPFLRTPAIKHFQWNEATCAYYGARSTKAGIELRNLDNLLGSAVRSGRVVLCNDLVNDRRATHMPEEHPRLKSFLGIPLRDRDELVGMIGVANRPGGYGPEIVHSLQPFVQTCATLIQREIFERERIATASALAHEKLRMQATFDASLDGLIIVTRDSTIVQVNPALCEMFGYQLEELVGKSLTVLMPERLRRAHEARIRTYDPARSSQVVNNKQRITGVRKDGREFPIELSVVLIDDPLRGRSFAGTIRDLTDQLRQEQAVAVAHTELARANAELQRLARTDRLTGLSNRRSFDEALEAELRRAMRAGHTFALAICDIDYFKELNDQLGHQVGDEYLVRTARALEHSFRRSGELVARWGGEEFALLVPHVPSEEAATQLGERVLCAVREAGVARPTCPTGNVLSVSVGVAWSALPGADSVDGLLRMADGALYRAKRGGRDRACMASPPPAVPTSSSSTLTHH